MPTIMTQEEAERITDENGLKSPSLGIDWKAVVVPGYALQFTSEEVEHFGWYRLRNNLHSNAPRFNCRAETSRLTDGGALVVFHSRRA